MTPKRQIDVIGMPTFTSAITMVPLAVLLLFFLTSAITIALIMKRPYLYLRVLGRNIQLQTYFLGALFGPFLIILFGVLNYHQIIEGIEGTAGLNPIGVLILFLSMVFMSIFLDITGFFEYCARLALQYAGGDGRRLFFALYVVVSVLTTFTSNDIIVLTFTPFIFYFTRDAGINPRPYLIAEFFAANTWSMMLYIGNPTNIVLATAFGIGFDRFTSWMFLPTLGAGLTGLAVLYMVFRKEITQPMAGTYCVDPSSALSDRQGAYMGLLLLGSCIITLMIAPSYGVEMWIVSLAFALLLLGILVIRDYAIGPLRKNKAMPVNHVVTSLYRMPWSIIPFVLSLFVTVEALRIYGITGEVGARLSAICGQSPLLVTGVYGITSALTANVVNNIPMTVAFTSIIRESSTGGLLPAVFATTVGSNLGANLTPLGSLAGIMWMSILAGKEVRITFRDFLYYGMLITPLTLITSLVILGMEFGLA
ncbi:MAG: hypothetical protein LUO82_04380 [Methanomicrobiales archaeon]|nr:hypothetical protein [Methanomicrobiales archaeon]